VHRGFCRAAQRILCIEDFSHAEDFFAQRILSRRGFSCAQATGHAAANDWFSGQLQDHFLTNWRGILKIPERFLSRTNQIIKTSLRFEKSFIFW
jgi:hypothetical protein